MAKVWRKALLQWQEPNEGAIHQPGDVYEIDTEVVFDDADLLRGGTHVEADPPPAEASTKPRITKVTQGAASPIKPEDLLPESEAQ